MKFNELSEMVKKQRGVMEETTGASVNEPEWDLMAWCRSEAGMSPLASGRDNEDSGVETNDMAGEDEVEPAGECEPFESQQRKQPQPVSDTRLTLPTPAYG